MSRWEVLRQEFLKDLALRGMTERTRDTYRLDLEEFLRYLRACGIEAVSDVTVEVLRAYQTDLFERVGARGRRRTLATQAHHLATVRSFFGYLYRRGLILTDPTRLLVMPKVKRRLPAVILTEAEVDRFLSAIEVRTALGIRDRAMFETLYSTAMRVSELAGLFPEDVDVSEGFVRIVRGKGQKSRVVPLGRLAARWIRRYLEEGRPSVSTDRPLFLTHRGRRLSRADIAQRAVHWAQRAKLEKKVTPHVLRHSCATHMLRRKASLRHLQDLLGHKDPSTTQIYTHVEITDLKKMHDRCHPRGRR